MMSECLHEKKRHDSIILSLFPKVVGFNVEMARKKVGDRQLCLCKRSEEKVRIGGEKIHL